jgi:hypothetical protein
VSVNKEELPELEKPFARPISPFTIAMIIDGTVYQVFHLDGQQAAQYLSNPEFIQINYGDAEVGWEYNDGKFSFPENAENYLRGM